MALPTKITVTQSAGTYYVTIRQPCGHQFASPSGWNDEAAARRHGEALLRCYCGACQ